MRSLCSLPLAVLPEKGPALGTLPLPGTPFQTVMRFSRYCSDRIVRYA